MREVFELSVKRHFDAAHRLTDYNGKCSQLHGHRWDVEVIVEGFRLDTPVGMLVDFSVIKLGIDNVLNKYDHRYLNEVLHMPNVTAEMLASILWAEMPGWYNVSLKYIKVWESPECCITYHKEDSLLAELVEEHAIRGVKP